MLVILLFKYSSVIFSQLFLKKLGVPFRKCVCDVVMLATDHMAMLSLRIVSK